MRRYFCLVLSVIMIITSLCVQPSLSEEQEVITAPLSPEYLEWLAELESGDVRPGGHIPFPADLSHLADNPPDESLLYPAGKNKAATIPTTYDLRNVSGKSYVTSVKNQNPYGTCWAHAALGAMESNYLKQGGSAFDLSEMHLAYFTYRNSDNSKAFENYTSGSVAYILGLGGNSFFPAAIYSRLDGPVPESVLPYPTYNPKSTPESYSPRVLRLRDVYYLAFSSAAVNVNSNAAQRTIVKQRIMETGSVVANYYDADSGYNNGRTTYYRKSSSTATNHAIQIIGWNDSYSRNNFNTNPGIDGAWLIKNSWGENFGDGGYMWMSYAQYLSEGSAFIVEAANPDMQAYYYDPLGWTGSSSGFRGSQVYMANSFKATRDGEQLIEVGFYTTDNNQTCKISVYTGQGASMPSSPTSGTIALNEQTVTHPYAGYHTVTLSKPVALTQGQYFSVIVKYEGTGLAPLASKTGMSPNYVFQEGSFFSSNGSSWTPGSSWQANAPLKAFTVTSATTDGAPSIVTTSLPDAPQNAAYTALLYAYGANPITWSIESGSLPSDLTLDKNTGIISGKTTAATGSYTFTVLASNSEGSADKTLTIIVNDLPAITPTTVTGYVGYNMNEQLELSTSASAVWSIDSDSLPAELKKIKINESTGLITGKPSKVGTYTVKVYADIAAGTVEADVTFTIEAKPVKPTIKTSALKTITIGESVSETLETKGTEPITFTLSSDLPSGLRFDESTGTFSGTPTVCGTYTMLITASNVYNTATGKAPTAKKIKITINGVAPEISTTSLAYGLKDEAYSETAELSAGTLPITWSASGLPKGLTINNSGDISGTPVKAGEFKVTLQAKNNGGTDKTDKIPLFIYDVPEIKTKTLKKATTDKAYSMKLLFKNNPSRVVIRGLPDTLEQSTDKKGNTIITGTPTAAAEYSVSIDASNPAGSTSVVLPLVVNGVKPKIKASLPKGEAGKAYEGTITVTGTKPMTITCSIPDEAKTKFNIESLDELGLTFTADGETGTAKITGTPKYSVKSLPVAIYAQNSITTSPVIKKAKLTIKGTKPAFTSPASGTTYSVNTASGSTVNLDFAVTGTDKITFSLSGGSGYTLTQTGEKTAALTGTAGSSATLKVTAKNADGKATMKVNINVQGAGSNTKSSIETELTLPGLPLAGTEKDSEDTALTLGESRSGADLTQSQKAVLDDEGYIVVAVLPQMSAEQSGIYDVDAVLDEDAETGAEMFWLAFPKNAEESEDDSIAEFYGKDGQEISGVPESHEVIVSVWLNEGVIYEPVIAVKKK